MREMPGRPLGTIDTYVLRLRQRYTGYDLYLPKPLFASISYCNISSLSFIWTLLLAAHLSSQQWTHQIYRVFYQTSNRGICWLSHLGTVHQQCIWFHCFPLRPVISVFVRCLFSGAHVISFSNVYGTGPRGSCHQLLQSVSNLQLIIYVFLRGVWQSIFMNRMSLDYILDRFFDFFDHPGMSWIGTLSWSWTYIIRVTLP